MNDWIELSDKTPPKNKEVLLFEPQTESIRKENRLRARVVVATYPTHYPRKATHWLPIPDYPK